MNNQNNKDQVYGPGEDDYGRNPKFIGQNNKGMVEEIAKSKFGIKSIHRHNDELSYVDGFKEGAQWAKKQSDGDRWVSKDAVRKAIEAALTDSQDYKAYHGIKKDILKAIDNLPSPPIK